MPVEARPPALRRDLRSILQPGDILLIHNKVFDVAIPGHWTHCGIYTGEGTVVESTFINFDPKIYILPIGEGILIGLSGLRMRGVKESSLSEWEEKGELKVVRWVGTGDPVKDAKVREYAVRWARSQKGKWYDVNWTRKQAESWESFWYCSELVWAAYWPPQISFQPVFFFHGLQRAGSCGLFVSESDQPGSKPKPQIARSRNFYSVARVV